MFSVRYSLIHNIVIREQEIIDIITTLPSNKASGLDDISDEMLKSAMYTFATPLC